jgi:hypothetical protein
MMESRAVLCSILSSCLHIVDPLELHMDGLNMLRSLTDMDQKAYPERLGKLFIVNSPYVFVKVYSMIKKWLDPGGKVLRLESIGHLTWHVGKSLYQFVRVLINASLFFFC